MISPRALAAITLAVGAGYASVLALGARADAIVHSMALALLPVLSGMLIGAVGVYLGSLGNFLSAMHANTALSADSSRAVTDSIGQTVDEVRDNVLLSIGALAGVFVLEILAKIDIPGVRWPFQQEYLSKGILVSAASVALVLLTLLAVVDCVRVMFTLHAQYAVVLAKSKSGKAGDVN